MVRVVLVVPDAVEWRRTLRTIRAHAVFLLEARPELALGEAVELVLSGPDGAPVAFDGHVIHRSVSGSVSLEIANPEGRACAPDPLAPATLPAGASPGTPPAPTAPDEGDEPVLDAADALTAEYDVDVGRLLGEEAEEAGTEVMELDDEVEALIGTEDDATVAVMAVEAALEEVPEEVEGAFEAEDATRVDEAPAPPEGSEVVTALARLQAMNPVERRRFALVADRLERSLLMRDGVKQIQMFVLKNPRLDDREILDYARLPGLTPEVITQIAANPRWIRSSQVRLALVRNTSTPRGVAKRLLETLTIAELFLLAKTGEVKTEIQQLARAVLERRGFAG